ncbi:MAG: nicotinate (nicotinamide) nucleotide adenylyltransferase [Candidatus Omnitrophica bacterium]|nr:nicotinate (nicotinamide) nucleotide adenylyltransferase [Candidatus Omnitrophota bacterium]
MRLGIFGGTFNPIHIGHLLLAETAREELSLDRVLFVPTHQPPHKTAANLLPGAERFQLVQLAIKDHPNFVASDIELTRGGPSYSIETVKTLHAQLPMAKLFLLMGEDMLAVRWLSWKELKGLCAIVIAHRPNSPKCRREAGVKWLDMPQVDIASSDIRKRLKAGRSIRYLVPPAVARHLYSQRLYGAGALAAS